MATTRRMSWLKHRLRFRARTRQWRDKTLWRFVPQLLALEERCLLDGTPFDGVPLPSTPDTPKQVIMSIDPAVPLKTVTFTNNSNKTVFPFLLDANSRADPTDATRALFDPIDPINQEYREYVGFSVTSGGTTTSYLGLPAGQTITIPVPLVFWDAGRMIIGTDGSLLTNDLQDGAPVLPGDPPNPYQYYARNGFPSPVPPPPFDPNDRTHGTPTLRAQDTANVSSSGPAGNNGLVMYYHAIRPLGPTDDAPAQLAEFTIRDAYLKTLTTGPIIVQNFPGEVHALVNYDVSYVDSMALPVAMEALDVPVPIPNPNNPPPPAPPIDPPLGPRLPYGWIGAAQTVDQFQVSLGNFINSDPAINGTGKYFYGPPPGSHGYTSFFNPNAADGLKVPSGQVALADSPLADVRSAFSQINYALTSGGTTALEVVGGASANSDGTSKTLMFNGVPLDKLNTQLQVGMTIQLSEGDKGKIVIPDGTKVGSIIFDNDKNVIGVNTVDADGNPVQIPDTTMNFPSGLVFTFTRPVTDFVSTPIINLWYSWAKYYADNKPNTAQMVAGHTDPTTGNILVLDADPTGSGLAPGMEVSGNGISTTAGQPTTVVSMDGNKLFLSQVVTQGSGMYTFGGLSLPGPLKLPAIPGATEAQLLNNFTPTATPSVPDPLKFAEDVYVVMKAFSTVPTKPDDKHPASNRVLLNSVGGNVAKLPNIAAINNGLPPPPVFLSITTKFRDIIKSILRGVNDYKTQSDQSLWYPDPSAKTGGQQFNVFNLDPFVWFVHQRLGLSGYGFSLDDDVADVGADWATKLAVSIGGLNGLPNQVEWTTGAFYGPESAMATVNADSPPQLLNLPINNFWSVMPDAPDTGGVGAFVTGPAVKPVNLPTVPPTRLLRYGDLKDRNFILNQSLDFSNVQPGTYTYTFTGAGTANTAARTLPSGETDAAGPYTNTATVSVGVGSELKITGTLDSYTQGLQQLSLLTGMTPPDIGTVVDGTLDAGRVSVVNGVLSGTGTINGSVFLSGPVKATADQQATTGGTLEPGDSGGMPGKLTVGSMTTPGDVSMFAGSFAVDAKGASTPGSDYGQLFSFGKVNLGTGNLILNLVGGYTPKAGDSLTIISAAGGVTGTFQQGSSITVDNTFNFTISYNKNSVVLTYAPLLRSAGVGASGAGNSPGPLVQDNVVAFVRFLYLGALKRPPHRVELLRWERFLLAGGSPEHFAFVLFTSPDYLHNHPTLSSFITGLYAHVLGRMPDAKGLAMWERFAEKHPGGRDALVQHFLNTPEAQQRLLLLLRPPGA